MDDSGRMKKDRRDLQKAFKICPETITIMWYKN